ncbi:MAG: VOC family protein, partial [Candidatus Saccharibacteria bacterium]|nr:VOC family protein [Candidatus Saccharibacteria bacterium]
MATINPYINFNGNAEEAFTFYKSVFGGEFVMLMRFKDVPAEEMDADHQMPDSEGQKIMHVSLPVGQSTILMGSDVPSVMGTVQNGSNFAIAVSTDSEAET